jgi:hypothetical protein
MTRADVRSSQPHRSWVNTKEATESVPAGPPWVSVWPVPLTTKELYAMQSLGSVWLIEPLRRP